MSIKNNKNTKNPQIVKAVDNLEFINISVNKKS